MPTPLAEICMSRSVLTIYIALLSRCLVTTRVSLATSLSVIS
jgi:hypothetical protein